MKAGRVSTKVHWKVSVFAASHCSWMRGAAYTGEDGYPDTLRCTAEASSSPLDPDSGATSDGQCCDPLGQSSALPACNAYRTVQRYVAAAAEITDEPRDTLPPICD